MEHCEAKLKQTRITFDTQLKTAQTTNWHKNMATRQSSHIEEVSVRLKNNKILITYHPVVSRDKTGFQNTANCDS